MTTAGGGVNVTDSLREGGRRLQEGKPQKARETVLLRKGKKA